MDKIYEQTMLFDFYGELLTEHQRKVYEDAVYNDMSLAEIAEEQGISRQGVHDLIKRCDKILAEYEQKLHLVARFSKAKNVKRRQSFFPIRARSGNRCDSADSNDFNQAERTRRRLSISDLNAASAKHMASIVFTA